jgi:AcrR family transcriptional regulator
MMDNRSNILECALRLFARRGYDAVGVQELVEAAGITKPTLYHYFGSKRGLLDVLLAEQFNHMYQVIEPAVKYSGDLPLTLEQITMAYFQLACDHPVFYRLQLAMWFAPPDSEAFQAVINRNQRQQQILEALFERAAFDHGNMRGRQRAYASTFLGMINTYISLYLNGYVKLDSELAYQAVHQYMHGIFS